MSKLSAITSADGYTFDFEEFVKHDLAITLAIDHNSQICRTYLKTSNCPLGPRCPYKHPASARKVVCKHWLRGLCKKGDGCEFLHEYNMRRMPECWFFSKYGECSNPECEYRHIDPSSKVRECPWFARGFCKHGPKCKNRHVKKPPCYLYLAGFCPHGKACENGHPKFEVATVDDDLLLPEDSNNADGRLDHIGSFVSCPMLSFALASHSL
ncbi:hypothetical protein BCR44DRAFT_35404 [Catenaria anguillulae PL171]|uniref:mRNA 3'-end-processing protein n=1 Tax=Catenaria anguillulae PL171 TaxID=765915 RepID=A0A1Y2HME7_9FUNG|nr:hypothetical protein BCR44DRAFT_35404 [Catenaria anguillulae PL171]